jgi:hypothetical protein
MCLFMSMIFILIGIKFDIDVNNDELLIITWEHYKKENRHFYLAHSIGGAQVK